MIGLSILYVSSYLCKASWFWGTSPAREVTLCVPRWWQTWQRWFFIFMMTCSVNEDNHTQVAALLKVCCCTVYTVAGLGELFPRQCYTTSTLSTFLTIWVVWSLEWEREKIMSKGRIIMLKCDFTSMFPGNHPDHRCIRLVRFWPDHFFGDLLIHYLCVLFMHTYYSWTTSKSFLRPCRFLFLVYLCFSPFLYRKGLWKKLHNSSPSGHTRSPVDLKHCAHIDTI